MSVRVAPSPDSMKTGTPMETPREIGARVWDLDAKAWVDTGAFSDKGLHAAGLWATMQQD